MGKWPNGETCPKGETWPKGEMAQRGKCGSTLENDQTRVLVSDSYQLCDRLLIQQLDPWHVVRMVHRVSGFIPYQFYHFARV